MLVDSHCHLNYPDLSLNLDDYLTQMKANQVDYALCVATSLESIPEVIRLAENHPQLFASVGVHPDDVATTHGANSTTTLPKVPLSTSDLIKRATHPKVVALGETGLDYYHSKEILTHQAQQQAFVCHIEAATTLGLPLIIHTRDAADDTLDILKANLSEGATNCGGVMHCFTESVDYARKFLDLGFYISISGIVTFKSAQTVQETAKYVPLDRLLIETDSPFLAPVPFRGKTNHPALLRYTAQHIADLRQISLDNLAKHTTSNFFKLFTKARALQ